VNGGPGLGVEKKRSPDRSGVDPFAVTRAQRVSDQWAERRPEPVYLALPRKKPRRTWQTGCLVLLLLSACLLLFGGIYLLAPFRTNILLLGIDRSPEGTDMSRTDTNILVTVVPLQPYVGMLSIPRDLWVNVPGVGENRINTAHFFAENAEPGSGPYATLDTVRENFGIDVDYYVRIRFNGLQEVVEELGGVEIVLESPTAGYPPGVHTLNGEQALAFVRDRSGTDDFFRMQNGQLFLTQMLGQILNPVSWPRLPGVFRALNHSVDTDIPLWQWPRLGLALIRARSSGIDNRIISRDMVNPFTTSQGAQVLGPNWDRINPVLLEMFGP
jgi:polyisoprenyl-teichoic acid--peptidoglycan teichoic acid transferase